MYFILLIFVSVSHAKERLYREAYGISRSHSVVNLEDEVELMEGMTMARSSPVELLLDIMNSRMVQTRMG